MPIPITMPRLSDTMESGTIIKWNVKEGDKVSAGDVVADVETDKATMEMAVYDDGTVAKIAVPEGKSVSVGTVIAVLAEQGEDLKEAAASVDGEAAAKAAPPKAKETPREEQVRAATGAVMTEVSQAQLKPATAGTSEIAAEARPHDTTAEAAGKAAAPDGGRVRVSPVARRLAEEHDIDLRSIEGTGPGGRIIKRDVLNAIQAAEETAAAVPPSARPQAAEEARREEAPLATRVPMAAPQQAMAGAMLEACRVQLSNMRQTIARRLVESKQTIPHYQVTYTFNMDPLLELRSALNEQLKPQGVKLSVNDFLVRACALAIHQHPEFNASWGEDHLEIHGEVNIGIAISLPTERGGGLVVATIRNADQKGLRTISYESKMLAEKARTRGLSLQEMADSTFTISNLGMYGVDNFTAIINPPNSAILAVGAAVKKPVVRNDELTIGHEMSATLSCDHRIIDGAMAAEYLQTLRQLIENPATLMV